MGIASYLVLTSGCQPHARANALYIYFLQLGINAVWPILFFKLGALAFAFIWCILLSIAVFLTLIFFFFCKKISAILMLPYFFWVLFTLLLNYSIVKLN